VPTLLGHAAVSAAFASACCPPGSRSGRLWAVGAICSILPDADVLAFAIGIPYAHVLGHRGLSHSLAGAVMMAAIATLAAFGAMKTSRRRIFLLLFFVTASHGVLDAMTSGGLGVAFFAPFSNERFFLPWRPILVSPIRVARVLSPRGLQVVCNELVWVWVPSLAVAGTSLLGWTFATRWAARHRVASAPKWE
jgi:inner membrane protein